MRTATNKNNFLITMLAAILVCCISFSPAIAHTTDKVSGINNNECSGVSVLETKSGLFLCGKNADKKFYPASTTKILTAIVVLEKEKDLEKKTTVSNNAVYGIDPSSSTIDLHSGEKISIHDLLYGLLLASGNDCAVALAEETGGSVREFAKMMNAKAKEIGAVNSHFVNPHGLHNKNHYTTPNDLAKIMNYCIRNPKFVQIIKTLKYNVKRTNKSKKRELWNSHRMLKYKTGYYRGIVGGKTGFTHEAGVNLVTYAIRGDLSLITVCMKAPNLDPIDNETRDLLNKYFRNYKSETIAQKDIPESVIKKEDKNVKARAESDVRVVIPKKYSASALKKTVTFNDFKLPVKKEQQIGTIEYTYGDHLAGRVQLVSTDDYKTAEQTKMEKMMMIVAGALALVIILVCIAAYIRRNKRNDIN